MTTNPLINEETELIQKRPLKEDIFDVLHGKIISGTYQPGDWLRQEEIATQLGVSMTPVREALDLLVSAGLAERVPYRGVRVREESTKNIAPEQLAGLEAMLDEMKTHESLEAVSDARQLSREFHSAIAEASRN